MKKLICILGALGAGGLLFAQYSVLQGTAGPLPAESASPPVNIEFTSRSSAHYEVFTPAGVDAEPWLREMELRFEVYNRLFRFNSAALPGPLKVRVFTDLAAYNGYVAGKLGLVRDGAVYLHYNSFDRRELVILKGSAEAARLIPHQAFIQFARGFVKDIPAWIREGFAVYFSTLTYNESADALEYEENLAWLDTVKQAGPTGPETILLADRNASLPPNFQGLSWALVSFFLESGDIDYFRTLTDSFMVLNAGATAVENAEAIYRRLTLFTNLTALARACQSYIGTKKTFAELIDQGQKNYAAKNYAAAEADFKAAGTMKGGHYAPFYYLALLAYDRKQFAEAEALYKNALDAGAERALVQYARGVNAAAAGNQSAAESFFEEAARLAPAQYRAKTGEFIRGMR